MTYYSRSLPHYRGTDIDNSKWLHRPGDVKSFSVKIVHVGRYGIGPDRSYQHIMKDLDGNVITFTAPWQVADRMTSIEFTARVYKHHLYKGVKQTVVRNMRLVKR